MTNNSLSLVLYQGYACKYWFWICLLIYGGKVSMRINIRTLHMKANKANIVSVFCIHEITRNPLWKYIQYILKIFMYIWVLRFHCSWVYPLCEPHTVVWKSCITLFFNIREMITDYFYFSFLLITNAKLIASS